MSQEKPEGSEVQKPVDAGAPTANGTGTPPADPVVEATDAQLAHLKGLGLEDVKLTPELLKVVDVDIKQKATVSELSRTNAEYKVRLESQGKPSEIVEDPEPTPAPAPQPIATPPTPAPNPAQEHSSGISENDLFDLSRDIARDFPAVSKAAEEGELVFDELRARGFFGVQGYNKKDIYAYLGTREAQLKEIQELREFKQKHAQPDAKAQPTYDFTKPIAKDVPMNEDLARATVMAAVKGQQVDERTLNDAREFLQKNITKVL